MRLTTTNKQRRNILQLFAILITLLCLIGHDWLPKKTFTISNPTNFKHLQLYSGYGYEYGEEAAWLDKKNMLMRCTITQDAQKVGCGIDIIFYTWPQWSKGVDLSSYNYIHFDIEYKGPAKQLRFFARNFNKTYSNTNDFNSAKYNTLNLRIRDLGTPINVPLADFVTADWWLDQHDIPFVQSQVEFNNVTSMGFDFGSPIPPGEHQVHFKKIQLVGDHISSEHWYLSIIMAWMLGISVKTIRSLIQLRDRARRYSQQVQTLKTNNTDLKNKADKLEELSTTDALTGTNNRLGIEKIIDELFPRRDTDSPLTAILIDIDYFKKINDTLGHDTGDAVLKKIGRTISNNVRGSDYVGRWGGEEFIVISPGSTLENARELAEKIRALVENIHFDETPNVHVSASFGVGEAHKEEPFAELFKRVDNALYSAKAQGRNQTVLAEEK